MRNRSNLTWLPIFESVEVDSDDFDSATNELGQALISPGLNK
jgi:hypothetical protein